MAFSVLHVGCVLVWRVGLVYVSPGMFAGRYTCRCGLVCMWVWRQCCSTCIRTGLEYLISPQARTQMCVAQHTALTPHRFPLGT